MSNKKKTPKILQFLHSNNTEVWLVLVSVFCIAKITQLRITQKHNQRQEQIKEHRLDSLVQDSLSKTNGYDYMLQLDQKKDSIRQYFINKTYNK
jgi:ascorbate-specific PTS system EIIC-type component UlaA